MPQINAYLFADHCFKHCFLLEQGVGVGLGDLSGPSKLRYSVFQYNMQTIHCSSILFCQNKRISLPLTPPEKTMKSPWHYCKFIRNENLNFFHNTWKYAETMLIESHNSEAIFCGTTEDFSQAKPSLFEGGGKGRAARAE